MKKALVSILSMGLLLVGNSAFAAVTVTDVTNGAEIRGITTPADASGFANVAWDGEMFHMHAAFIGLSDPIGDDFYEGWLVRKVPFAFISTGKLVKQDGEYHDFFNGTIDYTGYDEYVLTLEPNDGNDAPADHILEGSTTLVSSGEFTEKEVMMEEDEMMMKLTDRQKEMAARIEARIANLSDAQKTILLERVVTFQGKLSSLNISDGKKAVYAEILDVLVYLLS